MTDQTDFWPIKDIVLAQRMACEGSSFDDIAAAVGRSVDDVRRHLEPDPSRIRQEFAKVGYPHLKAWR